MSDRAERAADRAGCLFMGCTNAVFLIAITLLVIFLVGLGATLLIPEVAK